MRGRITNGFPGPIPQKQELLRIVAIMGLPVTLCIKLLEVGSHAAPEYVGILRNLARFS
jgi:hypothetical protein